MTKTKALKNFINKFLGYEAEGNSVATVLNDATNNASSSDGNSQSVMVGDRRIALVKKGNIVYGYIGSFPYTDSFELPDGFKPISNDGISVEGFISNNIPMKYSAEGTVKDSVFHMQKDTETGSYKFTIHGYISDPSKAHITTSQFFYFAE